MGPTQDFELNGHVFYLVDNVLGARISYEA